MRNLFRINLILGLNALANVLLYYQNASIMNLMDMNKVSTICMNTIISLINAHHPCLFFLPQFTCW